MRTLAEVQTGDQVVVYQVAGSEKAVATLSNLGIVSGAPISVEKVSRMQQTVEIVVAGHRRMLKFPTASLIQLYDADDGAAAPEPAPAQAYAPPPAPAPAPEPAPFAPPPVTFGAAPAAPAAPAPGLAFGASPSDTVRPAAPAPAPAPAPYAPPPAPAPAPFAPAPSPYAPAPAPAPFAPAAPVPAPYPPAPFSAAPFPAAPATPPPPAVEYEYRVVPVPVFDVQGWQAPVGDNPAFAKAAEAAAAKIAVDQFAQFLAENTAGGWELLLKAKVAFDGAASPLSPAPHGEATALVFRRPRA